MEKQLVELAIHGALAGGLEIMKIYVTADFQVEMKSDNSPLTIADRKANDAILTFLKKTNIPVLSEENDAIPYAMRREWDLCWIVDPLDGTKEFINRNDEFTVNIALVHQGKPVLGVVYAPALNNMYFSIPGEGAFKISSPAESTPDNLFELGRQRLPVQDLPLTFTIVGSRSHSSPETEAYIEEMKAKHGEVDFAASGSSLKFCLLAEGKAHSYPRFAPTMEWDTAAGQAVLEAAGGKVVTWPEQEPLRYNREELRNPWFLATI